MREGEAKDRGEEIEEEPTRDKRRTKEGEEEGEEEGRRLPISNSIWAMRRAEGEKAEKDENEIAMAGKVMTVEERKE